MAFQIATRKQRWAGVILAVSMGIVLTQGFLPFCQNLGQTVLTQFIPAPHPWFPFFESLLFPLLAFTFWICLPLPKSLDVDQPPKSPWIFQLILPFFISLGFGILKPKAPFTPSSFLWTVIWIPIGEEFLFRGWLYQFYIRLLGPTYFTLTNPLPTAVWLTAISFSLWHLQNWGSAPAGWIVLQVFYTFFVGLWLGYLRFTNKSLFPGWVCHLGLNLAAEIPVLLKLLS